MSLFGTLRPAIRVGTLSTASTSSLLVPSTGALLGFAFGGSVQTRNSTKRGGGSTKNNRNSAGRRLGVKRHQGHFVQSGDIIYRQRGTSWHAGPNVMMGKDHTLFATAPGYVHFFYPEPITPTTTASLPKSAANLPIKPLAPTSYAARQIVTTPHPSSKKDTRRYVGVSLYADQTFPRPQGEVRQRMFDKVDLESLQRDIEAVKLDETV